MTIRDPTPTTRAAERPRRFLAEFGRFEVFAGTILWGLLTCAVVMLCSGFTLLTLREHPVKSTSIVRVVVVDVLLAVEVLSFIFFVRNVQADRDPVLLSTANNQWLLPILLRPIAAAWWLAHFVMLALASDVLLNEIDLLGGRLSEQSGYERLAIRFLQFLFLLAVSFGANAFLLLATSSLTRHARVVRFAYRSRFTLDLITAGVLLSLPSAFVHSMRNLIR